jgi:hypothetical protein
MHSITATLHPAPSWMLVKQPPTVSKPRPGLSFDAPKSPKSAPVAPGWRVQQLPFRHWRLPRHLQADSDDAHLPSMQQ